MRQSPGVDRRTEQWRREVGHELSSLRGHISRTVLLGNPEERCLCNGPREIPTAILDSLMTEPTPFLMSPIYKDSGVSKFVSSWTVLVPSSAEKR